VEQGEAKVFLKIGKDQCYNGWLKDKNSMVGL
jgi:hypothetical protein